MANVPATMRAIRVSTNGGAERLQAVDAEVPAPGPGQVLIRHHAIGVNFVDVWHRRGSAYPVAVPFIPGIEAAGTVVGVGDGVDHAWMGQRVAYTGFHNTSYADYGVVPADRVVAVADDIDLDVAAATAIHGGTAAVLTQRAHVLAPSDIAVVTSAGSGIGSVLTQVARAAGATVVATASSPSKRDYALACGADLVVGDYAELPDAVTTASGGQGATVAFDAVAADAFEHVLASLGVAGHYVLYGKTSGPVPPFDLDRLSGYHEDSVRGAARITWASSYHYLLQRDDLEKSALTVQDWIRYGTVRPRINHVFDLEEAAQAHTLLESREVSGKILLRPSGA